jgi:hypothetical protein
MFPFLLGYVEKYDGCVQMHSICCPRIPITHGRISMVQQLLMYCCIADLTGVYFIFLAW